MADPNAPDPNPDPSAWRAAMPRVDRVKVCQHIMHKLAGYYRNVPDATLKEKTRTFEAQAFTHARSRRDYLEKIAEGLSKVESQARENMQAAAMHPQAGGAAGVQAQAALRQQLQQQQRQAQQQATLQQRQIMHQQMQQQQQLQLQAQQLMLRQRQQQQHQQQQQPGPKPEPPRKPSASSKRQPGGPEGKKKGGTGSAKTGGGTGSSSTSQRGKSQALSHSNVNDAEALRRRAQMSGKQAAFSAAQGNMANVTNNEYLMALARQQAQQAQQGAQASAPLPQHGQPTAAGQVSQVQQAIQQSQQQAGQDQATPPTRHSQRSQGLPHQGMNVATSAAMSGMMGMDPANGSGNVENRREMAMALAATAAAAGVDFTQEQVRNLTPEQIRQVLAMASQSNRAVNFANMNNLAAPPVSSAPNMGNWMGQFANANGARVSNAQLQMGGQNALSHAIAFEKQKQLQHARQQQLQSANAQVGTGGAQGKQGVLNVAASAAAAGVTVPQMNAILAKEKARIDKSGGTPQEKQAVFADALRAASRAGGSQALHSNARGQMPNGAPSGVTAAAAAAAAAAGVSSVALSNAQRTAMASNAVNSQGSPMNARSATENEFWAKLEDMQNKYEPSLKKLFPIIRRLQERQPLPKQELFMKHLKDCFSILSLQRGAPPPPKLTITILERAEKFIHSVVTTYSQYVKDMVMNNMEGDPARRQQVVATIDEAASNGHVSQPGQNIQNQPGARVPSQAGSQQTKPEQALQQGVSLQLDAQQYARLQQQQQLQQRKKMLLEMQARQQQQQQSKQQTPQQQPLQSPHVPPQVGQQVPPSLPQPSQQLPPHQQQRSSSTQMAQGTGSESSKVTGKSSGGKGSGGRGRSSTSKGGRGNQSLPGSRGMSGAMPTQVQVQARTQAQVQAQVRAQVQAQAHAQAAQAQAQAAASAQAAQAQAAARAQAAQVQAAQAQVQAQALAQQNPHSRSQQIRAQQLAAHRAQLNRNQKSQLRHTTGQHSLPPQGSVPNGMKQDPGTNGAPGWSGAHPGQQVMSSATHAAQAPTRAKRPEMTIQQRAQTLEASVRDALAHTQGFEQFVNAEMKRAKSERIQNTLAAIRNNQSLKAATAGKKKGTKRQASLVDVDNYGEKDGVIKSKAVFECSSEAGLRLAKRPKNEAQDLKSLREAVEADCKAAQERNPLLIIDIIEEFGQPVVTCLLKITEIRLPKLVLQVQRGYPRKGGATYGFERPPMGWVGVLEEIRTRFKRALETAPAASVGVAAFLDAWAREADAVINGSHLSENR